jgi:hypothetical protein
MKTISIFAYDSLIVNDFLHLIDPMVRNLFNFEVYLYTAYGTSDTIGAVGISTTVINSIKMLKSRYKHVNNIAVYGLVATGNDTAPFESKQDEFSEWIMQHIEDLDLDGIALDYEFSTDWDIKKARYTHFIKTLYNDIPDKQISADIGSYKYSSVELSEICNTNIQVVNMGMYKSQPRAFNSELFNMYCSSIKHSHQIPAVSFTDVNILMNSRVKMLLLLGYNRLAIFNPITHANEYALDIASFIDGKSSSPYWIPSVISLTCVIGVDMMLAFIFYVFHMQVLLQLYILSGITIGSFGGACRYICIKNSMFDYSTTMYLTLQTILSLLWLCMLYYFNYCNGSIYSDVSCKNITDIFVSNSTYQYRVNNYSYE